MSADKHPQQKEPLKASLTPKIQAMGKKMVLQLHMVLRTIRIHDPTNQALLVATENLKDTINTLWAAAGGIRLQFVDDMLYLNDLRIRIDPSMVENIQTLRAEFAARGLGGLAFARPVDTNALREFLVLLARPVNSEEDAANLRQSLESMQQMKDLALQLLGPKTFAEHDVVEEIRVDRKTFALQTYAKALVSARECLKALKAGEDPVGGKLHISRIVQDLVDIGTDRVNLLIKMSAIKKADDYVFNHATNTSVLAIVIGKALQVERLQLVDLGIAAFLADMGFALLPEEMLASQQVFDEQEKADLRAAMVRMIRTLIGKGRINYSVLLRVMVAYEHHTPFVDPNTKERSKLHLFSRITAVADAYDALTTKRPWREGYTPDEAMKILLQEAGTKYDPLVVRTLTNLLGLYPLGTLVRLDTGEIGVVYHNSNDPKLFERPWVKIVRDAKGVAVKRTLIRNLAEHSGPGGKIVGIAKPAEVPELDPGMTAVL